MALARVEVPLASNGPIPPSVRQFLHQADAAVEQFIELHRDNPITGFVPSDYEMTYRALHWLRQVGAAGILPGNAFCEWGSGLAIVAGLAEMSGFDAVGIEIDRRLVEASRRLLQSHQLSAQIVQGSYVPDGYELDDVELVEGGIMTLETGRAAYEELGQDPDDFDCIFAYPWPGEDDVLASIFDRHAARGALLMTFHGQDGLMLRRKVR